MRVYPGNAQHIGSRKEQQDAFGFSDPKDRTFLAHGGFLAVVCDGMGGHANGREAAQAAVSRFLASYGAKTVQETPEEALRRALFDANEEVRSLAEAAGQAGNCGATLVAAVIRGDRLFWTSVGDSRIYLCDGKGLRQLTTDQIYARKLELAVQKGILTEEDASVHPDREALTSFVGIESLKEFEVGSLEDPLQEGVSVLLCSDGLFKVLSDPEILALFHRDSTRWAETLQQEVFRRNHPHQDNVTVAILGTSPPRRLSGPRRNGGRRWVGGLLAGALLAGAGSWWWISRRPAAPTVPPVAAIVRPEIPVSGDGGKSLSEDRRGVLSPDGKGQPVPSSAPPASHDVAPTGGNVSSDL